MVDLKEKYDYYYTLQIIITILRLTDLENC